MSVVADEVQRHHHAVQFYEEEDCLADRVATFLADGSRDGEPCVVIATAEHNAMFADRLQSAGADLSRSANSSSVGSRNRWPLTAGRRAAA